MTPEEKDRLKRIRMILKRGTAEPMPGDTVAIEHRCDNYYTGDYLKEYNCALPSDIKEAKVRCTTYMHENSKVLTVGIKIAKYKGKWIVQTRCISRIVK